MKQNLLALGLGFFVSDVISGGILCRDRLIYQYQPKQPILSASVSIVKTLLYSLRIQTTSATNHNEPTQDSYLATLVVRFHKQAEKINHGACVRRRSQNKGIIINQIN